MEATIANTNDEFFTIIPTKKELVLNLTPNEVLDSGKVELPAPVPVEAPVVDATPHPLGMRNLSGHSWFNGTSWGVN